MSWQQISAELEALTSIRREGYVAACQTPRGFVGAPRGCDYWGPLARLFDWLKARRDLKKIGIDPDLPLRSGE
jgi:hypothetical protein